ncbi:hypothetical protein DM01DRAFT_1403965 [Hesseltinella vesiculosa]|uniref:F-box domain-containing protein n=1 Tax=Hesseltinella vesiculosa TaxID=101127 RepID=A0A1X2GW66_9FUNG|nr:hypothetical protein DM01DRAFT_1403965 [Hesseltinella vesiculosa]
MLRPLKSRDTNIVTNDNVVLVKSPKPTHRVHPTKLQPVRRRQRISNDNVPHDLPITLRSTVSRPQPRISRLQQPPRRFRSILPKGDSSPESSPDNDTSRLHHHLLPSPLSSRYRIKVISPVRLHEPTLCRLSNTFPMSPRSLQGLPDDCVLEIFQWISDASTLAQMSVVCRQWHALLKAPSLWRTIDYNWPQFLDHLHSIDYHRWVANTSQRASQAPLHVPFHFSSIKTIHLHNADNEARSFHWTAMTSPFFNLHQLHLTDMFWTDILDLIVWTTALEELTCHAIRFKTKTPVSLSSFTSLRKLQVLRLHFGDVVDHQHRLTLTEPTPGSAATATVTSTMARRRHLQVPPKLPDTLRILVIHHLNDIEEHLMPVRPVDLLRRQQPYNLEAWRREWESLEYTLLQKYNLLLGSSHLQELSLGLCSAFTASVWKERLYPCTRHLRRLTLAGWEGSGLQEHPDAWARRLAQAAVLDHPLDKVMPEVEQAMADTIGTIPTLESLRFTDVACTPGLLETIRRLNKHRTIQAIVACLDTARLTLTLADLETHGSSRWSTLTVTLTSKPS